MGDTELPSDANGVYSLPNGYLAITGETIQASQHNPPLEDLAASMTQRLMRSGAAPMLGPLKAVDGTVGAPGLTFASATSTGFYKTSDGVGLAVNGAKVVEFGAGGLIKGGHFIGELIPWTGLTPAPLCVFPYGQTLPRADFPDLWAFAQAEIAAGNAFYNNGNGTTTFGIGDMRGCVVAARDNMGGTSAARLSTFFEGADSKILGARAGSQSVTLTTAQMPAHDHGVNDPGHSHTYATWQPFGTTAGNAGGITTLGPSTLNSTSNSATGISIQSNGSGQAHGNVQPTMVTNFILFAGA